MMSQKRDVLKLRLFDRLEEIAAQAYGGHVFRLAFTPRVEAVFLVDDDADVIGDLAFDLVCQFGR